MSGRRLTRSVFWNLLGTGGPLLAALVAIPLLIEGLGTARFGILTMAWMIVGYFSLFDLGLGRALTKIVAEKLGSDLDDDIPVVVWTAISLMFALGAIGTVLVIALVPWLIGDALNIPLELQPETRAAFYLLAISIPIVITSTGLRGILEAHQRFGIANAIRLPLGIFTFLGPLAILPFSQSISAMVAVLVVGRIFAWVANFVVCWRIYPALRKPAVFEKATTWRLLAFGGWMTVSNVTAPILLYAGRVLILALISAEAVAYFVTPYEVVIRLLIIPAVIVGVLFPAFSQLFQSDARRAKAIYRNAILVVLAIMVPLTTMVFMFAEVGLTIWIDYEFAQQSYRVARYLAIGVLINSIGHLSQALIQGYGRPDVTAKLHLAELAIYLPYLVVLIKNHGIEGAAIAWTIRVSISTVALYYLAWRCTSGTLRSPSRNELHE